MSLSPADDTRVERVQAPRACPRCGWPLDHPHRAVLPYCAVCRRGDLDGADGVAAAQNGAFTARVKNRT